MKIVDSKSILLAGAVLSLILTYLFGSKAIDSGRWLYYFLTFGSFLMAVQFGFRYYKYANKD